MGDIYLSIIIPAYNEENRISPTIRKIEAFLIHKRYGAEIIVVDDGSSDNTAGVIEKLKIEYQNITLVRQPGNFGKGAAVKKGALLARGGIILFSDADLSTPIEEADKLAFLIESGSDVVFGSRSLPGSNVVVRQPFYRVLMGKVFNLVVWLLLGMSFKDTQCGFKGFSKKAASYIFCRQLIEGFAFDVELIFIALKGGFKVREEPVSWYNSPDSRVSVLLSPLSMIAELVRIRVNYLKGSYAIEAKNNNS